MVAPIIIAAGIGAAASAGGGIMSSMGQASANAANMANQRQINYEQMQAQNHANELNQKMTDEGRQFAMLQQDRTQQFNLAEADKQRTFASGEAATARQVQNEFQERMASTQYQRAMEDMRKAGLNPMLAYQLGGNAAPTGSSAQAVGQAASASPVSGPSAPGAGTANLRAAQILNDKDEVGRALGNIVHSAMDTMRTGAQIEDVKESAKERVERVRKSGYETTKMDAETGRVHRETEKIVSEKELIDQTRINAVLQNVKTAAELKDIGVYGTHYTPNIMERIGRLIQGSVSEDLDKIKIQRKE